LQCYPEDPQQSVTDVALRELLWRQIGPNGSKGESGKKQCMAILLTNKQVSMEFRKVLAETTTFRFQIPSKAAKTVGLELWSHRQWSCIRICEFGIPFHHLGFRNDPAFSRSFIQQLRDPILILTMHQLQKLLVCFSYGRQKCNIEKGHRKGGWRHWCELHLFNVHVQLPNLTEFTFMRKSHTYNNPYVFAQIMTKGSDWNWNEEREIGYRNKCPI
jgi:hypothetical protein